MIKISMNYKNLDLDHADAYSDACGMRYEVMHTTDQRSVLPFGWGDTMGAAKTVAKKMVTVYGLSDPLIRDRHTEYLVNIHAAGTHVGGRPGSNSIIANELIKLELAKVKWIQPNTPSWATRPPRPYPQIYLTEKGEERVQKALLKGPPSC